MPQRRGFAGAMQGMAEGANSGAMLMVNENLRQQRETRAARLAMMKDFTDKVLGGADPTQIETAARMMGINVPKGYFHGLQADEPTRLSAALEPVEKATGASTFPPEPILNTRLQSRDLNPITTSDTPPQFIEPGSELQQLNPTAANAVGAKKRSLIAAQPETKIGSTTDIVPRTSNVPNQFIQGQLAPDTDQPVDYQPVDIFGQFDPFAGKTNETRRTPSGPSALTAGAAKGAETLAAAPGEGTAQSAIENLTRPGKVQTQVAIKQGLLPLEVEEDRQKKLAELKMQIQQFGMPQALIGPTVQMADAFTQQAKQFTTRETAYRMMLAFNDDPSAVGDNGIIYTMMHLFDPNATVGNSDYANASNAAGVPVQLQNLWNRMMSGERLSINRDDYLNQARNIYRASLVDQKRLVNDYNQRATKMGISPALVTRTPAPDVEQRSLRDAVKSVLQKQFGAGAVITDREINQFLKNNPNFQ